MESASRRGKKLSSTAKQLRGWVGSDPSKEPELIDALNTLTEHRLLAHAASEAFADAQEAFTRAYRAAPAPGTLGPLTKTAAIARQVEAMAHLAMVQVAAGQPEPAAQTAVAALAVRAELGRPELDAALSPAAKVWLLTAVARGAAASGDLGRANAYADAALARTRDPGFSTTKRLVPLAIDSEMLVADHRWAVGVVGDALDHGRRARDLAQRHADAALQHANQLAPADVLQATTPVVAARRDLADHLAAAGDLPGSLAERRALVSWLESLTGRARADHRATLGWAKADLAHDLLVGGDVAGARGVAQESVAAVGTLAKSDEGAALPLHLVAGATLAAAALREGDLEAAALALGDALERYERAGRPAAVAAAYALALLTRADVEAAHELAEDAEATRAEFRALADAIIEGTAAGRLLYGDVPAEAFVRDRARGVVTRSALPTPHWDDLSPVAALADAAASGSSESVIPTVEATAPTTPEPAVRDLQPAPASPAEPEPTAEPRWTPAPEPEQVPEPVLPEPETVAQPLAEPVPQPIPEPEWTPAPEPEHVPEPQWVPEPEPVLSEPELVHEPVAADEPALPEPVAEPALPEPVAEPALPEPVAEPLAEPEPEPVPAPEWTSAPEPEQVPEPEWMPEPVMPKPEQVPEPEWMPEPVMPKPEQVPEPEWVPEPVMPEPEQVPEPEWVPEPVMPEPEPVVEPLAWPEPQPIPEPERTPTPEPEWVPEPVAAAEPALPERVAEPVLPEPELIPEPEWTPTPEPEWVPEPVAAAEPTLPEPVAEPVLPEPELIPEPEWTPTHEPEWVPEPVAPEPAAQEPETEPEPEPMSEAAPEPAVEPEPVDHPRAEQPEPAEETAWTPQPEPVAPTPEPEDLAPAASDPVAAARALLAQGRAAEAEEAARAELQVYRPTLEVVALLRVIAAARSAQGDKKGVPAIANQVVEQLRPLADQDPTAHGADLVDALQALSEARKGAGDWWGSLAPGREAKQLAKRLNR